MEDGKLLGEIYQNTGLTHSQTLMVMAEDLLKQCGKTVEDISAVIPVSALAAGVKIKKGKKVFHRAVICK